MATALKQQRHIEHGERPAIAPAAIQEPAGPIRYQRMDDLLQPVQRRRVTEHQGTEHRTIHRATAHGVGKRLGDRRDRLAPGPHHVVDTGVGIVNRDTELAEHLRGRALAHAD